MLDEMINEEVLEYVKEHSPKDYAAQIKERCEAVIKKIEELLDTPEDQIEDVVEVDFGCPHCNRDNCSDCLWTEAGKAHDLYFHGMVNEGEDIEIVDEYCTGIAFKGVTWRDVQSFVTLKPDRVDIQTGYAGNRYVHLDCGSKIFKDAIKFLEGHIEWAEEDGWGNNNY